MAVIPVYCRRCGTIFRSRGVQLGPGSSGNVFVGNMETCINCGAMARIIDGTFDVSCDDLLSIVSGPSISKSVLQSFANLVDRAARDEISAGQLQQEVEKLDPALASVVANVHAKQWGIAGLILIVIFLRSCNFEAKLDLNRLFDQWTAHGTKQVYTPSPERDVKHAEEHKRSGNPKRSGDSSK